jgi:hypothetical protein
MSSETTKNSSSQTTPWAPQAGALTDIFNNAANAYGTASQATAPTNFTAQFTPDQLATFKSMLGYANGNTTPANQAAAGGALTNAGVTGATGALTGLAGYDPTKLNNPGALIDQANQYASGQNIDAEVANSMLPALQQARDVTLPGIEQNAATSGNTNSSRTGIADGLVQRGLAEQATNLGATLRNQAFTNGLALASGNANSNNSDILTALNSRLTGGTNAANSGINAGNTSINNAGTLYSLAENAGQGQQAADQANLTNQAQQFQSKTSDPYAALKQYYSILGANNWGRNTTGTETDTTTPSAWSVMGGLLGAAGSAAGLGGTLGWKPFAS